MNLKKQIKKWLYGSCPGFAGAFPYFGTKVFFPKNSFIFSLACQQGVYELENTLLISTLVRANSMYFDVGANIGLLSAHVLHTQKSCTVISFEPSPNTAKFLARTVANSSYRDRWKVVEKAVSSEVGTLDFFIASEDMGAYDGLRDTKRSNTHHKVTVPVTTLDTEWNALNRPSISLIKLDIEGAELYALKGALNCIENEQPYILLEWNTTNLKAYNCPPESLIIFANSIGYKIYALHAMVPINDLTTLKINMLKTENFLLAPSENSNINISRSPL